ncbi:CHAT domain-containing protein [Streptomyces sp. NPDC020141]|uniref:CHAT domain-containing protein n=1 Tax=Streptomyces sp. NPDC020141 TaxID=3365065 RepID=UPI0037A2D09B
MSRSDGTEGGTEGGMADGAEGGTEGGTGAGVGAGSGVGAEEVRARVGAAVVEAGAWISHAKLFGRAASGLGVTPPGEGDREGDREPGTGAGAGAGVSTGIGVGPPDPAARDRLIGELHALERELAPLAADDDPGLATLRSRLGGLYSLRYVAAPTDADRAEGLRALRAARGSGGLDQREEISAAVHTIGLLTPPAMVAGLDGTLPRLRELIDLGRRTDEGDPELDADLTELRDLVAGFIPKLPEGASGQLAQLVEWLDLRPRAGQTVDPERFARAAKEVMSGLRPGSAYERLLDACLMLGGFTGDFRPPAEAEAGARAGGAEGADAGEPDSAEEIEARITRTVLNLEVFAPGTIRAEDMAGLMAEFRDRAGDDEGDAVTAALVMMAQGLRTGEPGALEDAARLIGDATRAPRTKDSPWLERMAGLVSPGLLSAAAVTGGSLTDRDQLRARLDALVGSGASGIDSLLAGVKAPRELLSVNQCLHLQLRCDQAYREGEAGQLEELLDELLYLQEEMGPEAEWHFLVSFQLGMVHLYLTLLEGGTGALRTASAYFRQALEHPAIPAPLRPVLEAAWVPTVLLSSLFEPDAERLLEAVARARASLDAPALMIDQKVRTRMIIAVALQSVHQATGDRAHENEAVAELERARRGLTEHHSPEVTHELLWSLAQAYARRGDRARDDQRASVAAAQDSLRFLAEEVLLQLGAEHGLEVARAGASRALLAADWAARDRRADKAVEVLETGRALVLRAAAVSVGVSEQLAARGETELAKEWGGALRELPSAAAAPTVAPAAGLDEVRTLADQLLPTGADGTFTIPSTLRRRALGVLRRPEGGRDSLRDLLDAPGIAELREGVRASGADALVHLMPGQGEADGLAVLVRPEGEPEVHWLPGLGALGRKPLERYLDAGARRSDVRRGDRDVRAEADRAWESALEDLCAWAGRAVMGPLLTALRAPGADPCPPGAAPSVPSGEAAGPGEPGEATAPGAATTAAPVRLVVVACGNLGAVPWHAARLAEPPPGGTRTYSHACEHAVVSYAASGGEFLRSARRGRMPAGLRPVLVADPTGELDWAQEEVSGVRDAYYPGAAVHGWHPDAAEDAPGTPDDILARLPGGSPTVPPASLLHLVVHGVAGLRPTDSVLQLADPGGGFDASAEGATLTVTRLMDAPGAHQPAEGPLIVLSACETDLSSRDHDEALTPTTALLARGAADVVGSRWEVFDSASAALMVVFHHHLAVLGTAPPDALRAAQLWMTDPDRRPVPGLRGDLLTETDRNPRALAALSSWAGFIHQGNPAPVSAPVPRPGAEGTTV